MLSLAVCIFLLRIAAAPAGADGAAGALPPEASAVRVDYYFEAGCRDCFRVRNEILPQLEAACQGFYALHEYDIAVESNYLAIAAVMQRKGIRENASVFMVVDGEDVLAGADAMAERLVPLVQQRVALGLEGRQAPAPPAGGPDPALLQRRLDEFTVTGVILGGLVDGINPCAMSTLVFLISVLSLSRARGPHLLRVGAVYCLATFVTYTAIGFGLLHALHALAYFRTAQRAVDVVLVGILLALAAYSFRDALRYRRSRNPKDMTLQLPDGIKKRIHRMLRVGLGEGAQLASVFAIGAAVTGLESVCTGQAYVPTLALVVRTGTAVGRALAYLALYNVMFIVPLVVVFVLAYRGLKTAALLAWSAKNVVASKVLLGCFFLALAVVTVVLSR